MGFSDKIDNNTIVDALKHLFKRVSREIFSAYSLQLSIQVEYVWQLVELHKAHMLVDRCQIISMSDCVKRVWPIRSLLMNTESWLEMFLLCVTLPTVG